MNWFKKTYAHKEKIIIGYNKEWKKGINLGRETNRKFYQIPFCTLLKKLKYAMSTVGVEVITVEESYTSKCDALSLEEVGCHKEYLGIRQKRGLFSSATKKYINADINGAINILRKYLSRMGIRITRVVGDGIFNPQKVTIQSWI